MALNLTTFKKDLKKAILDAANKNSKDNVTKDEAIERVADAIAGEVDKYLKSATVTIATGLVQVQGSPSAQANVAPIVVNNGIS